MSNYINKYKIRYDGNDGHSYTEYLYCKYEGIWDGQKWCLENGTSLNFDCVTDSQALVRAYCIAGIPTKNKYEYWEQIEEFKLPKEVAELFNTRK